MRTFINRIKIKYIVIATFFSLIILSISFLLSSIKIKRNEFPFDIIICTIILLIFLHKFLYKEYYKRIEDTFKKISIEQGFIIVSTPEYHDLYTLGYIEIFKNKVRVKVKTQTYSSKIDISNIICIENAEKRD